MTKRTRMEDSIEESSAKREANLSRERIYL
jgi:hypothetical protein